MSAINNYRGYIDVIDSNSVSGWAANIYRHRDPITVLVFVNGKCVSTVGCSLDRTDAVNAGFLGAKGFFLPLGGYLSKGSNLVEVYFEDHVPIPNGSTLIDFNPDNAIGSFWSSVFSKKQEHMIRWWQSEYIVKRINTLVCGEPLREVSAGICHLALKKFHSSIPFSHGVSIGCGTGGKELSVIKSGLVDRFTLYELADDAIAIGKKQTLAAGISPSRMDFKREDGLSDAAVEKYDLVYWNNALHHMFDVKAALEWSKRVLRKGGLFLMDDFVGPTRFQWSDRLIEINSEIRNELPEKYLRDPSDPRKLLPRKITRPDPNAIMKDDPSECADSGNILKELAHIFPDAIVINTGGGVYHLGLNDVLHNIIESQDYELLEKLLTIDDQLAQTDETHYAVALAVK